MTGLQKVACALLLAMAIAAAVCIRPADGSNGRPSEGVTYAPYTVQYGDTLWGIAREHKPDGANTRDYMDKLKRHNKGLTADIEPGDVIQLVEEE